MGRRLGAVSNLGEAKVNGIPLLLCMYMNIYAVIKPIRPCYQWEGRKVHRFV